MGRYVLIRPHEVDRAHDWFERYGEAAVFFGRLLPVIRTFISLPPASCGWTSGGSRSSRCSAACRGGLLLTWLGYELGDSWESVERIFRPFAWAIAVAVVVAIVWFVWHRLRTIRAEEAERDRPAAEIDER